MLTIAYTVDLFIGRANHMGFPMATITLDNMLALLKASSPRWQNGTEAAPRTDALGG